MANGGIINGYGFTLSLSNQVASFTIPGALTLNNIALALNSNLILNAMLKFTSSCIVEGKGYTIDCTAGSLVVGNGASVLLKDVTLKNASGNRIYCTDNLGTFSFQNVTWILDNNYSFTQGRLELFNTVKVTGSKIFVYSSTKQSIIHSNATWYFDSGMTFTYDCLTNNLLNMQDNTAALFLYETTLYADPPGLNLTKGILSIDGICPLKNDLASSSTQGIVLGDGVSLSNNVDFRILSESGLNLLSGYFLHNNV